MSRLIADRVIATQTLAAPVASIVFSNIPQGFKNLRLRLNAKSDLTGGSTEEIGLRFNGDSGAGHYAYALVNYANTGSNEESNAATKARIGFVSSQGGDDLGGAIELTIPNYASSSLVKFFFALGAHYEDSVGFNVVASSGKWNQTAPITSIELTGINGSNFKAGTVATLIVE